MPGARHSKHSKNQAENRDRYGQRRSVETRPTLPVITIVCDDTKAAVRYFRSLHQVAKQWVTLRTIPAPDHGADPKAVLFEAGKHPPIDDSDSTWALIDVEGPPARVSAAHDAKKHESAIRVALSDPCFEVWILLHFVDEAALHGDCSSVIGRVSDCWKKKFGSDFRKQTAEYEKVIPYIRLAARRAKAHRERDDPSWTEIYELIAEILRFVPNNALPDTPS